MSSEPKWTAEDNKAVEENEGWWIGQYSKTVHVTKAIFLTSEAAMDFIIESAKQGSTFHMKAYIYLTYWKLRGDIPFPQPEIEMYKINRSGNSILLNDIQAQRIISGTPK